jgi:hypothetical protein
MSASGPVPPQIELARRVQLLMDTATVTRGKPYTAQEVITSVENQGVTLSRARWAYLVKGNGPLVSDARLLVALAKVFEVDVEYLVDLRNEKIPERVEAQMHLVRQLREARVASFAARSVGDMSPGLMKVIGDYLSNRREETDSL